MKQRHPVRFHKNNIKHYPALDLSLRRSIIGEMHVQEIPVGPIILKRLELTFIHPGELWSYFGFQTVKPINFNPKLIDDKYTSVQFYSNWLVVILRHGLYFKGYYPGPCQPFIPCEESWQRLLFYPVSVTQAKEIVLITNMG